MNAVCLTNDNLNICSLDCRIASCCKALYRGTKLHCIVCSAYSETFA